MREILFRGKRIDNGEWLEGFYADSGARAYILFDNGFSVGKVAVRRVDPETVGQFTGLTDKNGKKIFEGDIVTATSEVLGSPFEYGITGKIEYAETSFFIEPKDVAIVGKMPLDWEYGQAVADIYDIIKNAPAADAVRVVRCGECVSCKHCFPAKAIDEEPIEGWRCERYGRYVKPDGFCSYGERRTK